MEAAAIAVGGLVAAGFTAEVASVFFESDDDFVPELKEVDAHDSRWQNFDGPCRDGFVLQRYSMGSLCKIYQYCTRESTPYSLHDFRILLLQISGKALELAVGSKKEALRCKLMSLRRYTQHCKLGVPRTCCLPTYLPPMISQVIHASMPFHMIPGPASQPSSSLRYDTLRFIFECLTPSSLHALSAQGTLISMDSPELFRDGVTGFEDESPCQSACEVIQMGLVCSAWNAAVSDNRLWHDLLQRLPVWYSIPVSESKFKEILAQPILAERPDVISYRDIFILTVLEKRRQKAVNAEFLGSRPGALGGVSRGLYGLAVELLPGCAQCANNMRHGAGLGMVCGTCIGCITMCNPSLGTPGALGGAGVGAACSIPALAEGLALGGASCTDQVSHGLRQTPALLAGPWQDESLPRAYHGIEEVDRNVTWGLLLGIRTLGADCTGAITDLALEPSRGSAEKHPCGVAKGLGRALIGLSTRPVAGACGLTSAVLRCTGLRINQIRTCTLGREMTQEILDLQANCQFSTPIVCDGNSSQAPAHDHDDKDQAHPLLQTTNGCNRKRSIGLGYLEMHP